MRNRDSLLTYSVKRQATKTGGHFPLFFKPDCKQEQTEATCTCVVLVASLLGVVCGYQLLKELLLTTMNQTRKVSGAIQHSLPFPARHFVKGPKS